MYSQETLQRFQALLPFYVNGTINDVDKTFVDAFLLDNPDASFQLELERYLLSAMHDPLPERSSDASLDKLLKAWHYELPTKVSFTDRIREMFKDWGLSPAFAVAAVVVVIQSALLINQQSSIPDMSMGERFRAMSGMDAPKQQIKLSISPKTQYGQVVQLIKDLGCRIQDGPTPSGALIISCPLGQNVLQQLQSSSFVDDVISEKVK